MDLKKIEKIIELMQKHQVAEIEIDEGGEKLRVSAYSKAQPAAATHVVHAAAPAAAAPQTAAPAPAPAPANAAANHMSNKKLIRSPFVGTYYGAPSPGADPFVRPGQKVKKGDVLCIIEAMKLMNEIEAEADGVIAEVLADNSHPVEYDQPLFSLQ